MIEFITSVNTAVNSFIWGVPAMICIIGVGLFLSLRTRFIQIRRFPYAIRTTLGRMFSKKMPPKAPLPPSRQSVLPLRLLWVREISPV